MNRAMLVEMRSKRRFANSTHAELMDHQTLRKYLQIADSLPEDMTPESGWTPSHLRKILSSPALCA